MSPAREERPLPRDDFERYTRAWTAQEGILAWVQELADEHGVAQHRVEDMRDAALEPLGTKDEHGEPPFVVKLAEFLEELPEDWGRS